MKKLFQLVLLQIFIIILPISAQYQSDSLIRFTDLKYHSDFEKEAIFNFVKNKSDSFNLFLAINETMSEDEAKWRLKTYLSIFDDLEQKKIDNKKINQKIKLSYSIVHSNFLKKYNDNDYFPVIFQTGTYNCVSASILYALIFDELNSI